MKNTEKLIWIEAEEWTANTWNSEDTNSDVIVVFPDRSKWIASFMTYLNIETIRQKNIQTGECMHGAYYWSSDMVLIDRVSRGRIEEVIEYLIDTNSFTSVFTRYPDIESEDEEHYPLGFFT